MRKQKRDKTGGGEPSEGATQHAAARLAVEVEKASVFKPFDAPLLTGTVFYILDKDLSEVLRENRNAIWRDLVKKKSPFGDSSRGEYIREILHLPDNPRKYPAALILTADSLSRMTPVINSSYTKAIDVLRTQAVKFFIIDSEGKAEIEGLKAKTYYVCGVGETSRKSGVWNVRVELKTGKNSLKLDDGNITGRRGL